MRILIIEDEMKLAQSLKIALQSEAYAVDLAFDGEVGLEMGLGEEYDVIILDRGLPKIEGIEIARSLRKEKINTPILMLTARDTVKNKIEGLDSGADDYLVKPFQFEELLARIRALMRRNQATKETEYAIGSLKLNPQTHIVTRNNQEISLSAKEYALLEYMMRNAKSVLTKQQLIDHVWDADLDPFSNTIDVYIGYLRNKIDKKFPKEAPLIKTIKGLGYKIG